MKTKSFYLFVLFILSCSVIMQSCVPPDEDNSGPCPDPDMYFLSAAQKKILPYTGYDTITMVSRQGDTIHCIGTGKQYFTTREYLPSYSGDCGMDKLHEAYKIEFVDSVKNEKIELAHYENFSSGSYHGGSVIYVTFHGGNGVIHDDLISRNGADNFLGTTEIQGVQYSDVTKAASDPYHPLQFVLINRMNGIIKIQFSGNQYWELIKN